MRTLLAIVSFVITLALVLYFVNFNPVNVIDTFKPKTIFSNTSSLISTIVNGPEYARTRILQAFVAGIDYLKSLHVVNAVIIEDNLGRVIENFAKICVNCSDNLLNVLKKILSKGADQVSVCAWYRIEAPLSIAYLCSKIPCVKITKILNPIPTREIDTYNLLSKKINLIIALPREYVRVAIPYPPWGKVISKSCETELVNSWKVGNTTYYRYRVIVKFLVKALRDYRYYENEPKILVEFTSELGDVFNETTSDNVVELKLVKEIVCVNECSYSWFYRITTEDELEIPVLGKFKRDFTVALGSISLTDQGDCKIYMKDLSWKSLADYTCENPSTEDIEKWFNFVIGVGICHKIWQLINHLMPSASNVDKYLEWLWLSSFTFHKQSNLDIAYSCYTMFTYAKRCNSSIVVKSINEVPNGIFKTMYIKKITIIHPLETIPLGNNPKKYLNVSEIKLCKYDINLLGVEILKNCTSLKIDNNS